MENRDSFLADIARQLGREVRLRPMPLPRPASHHAQTRLVDLTAQQRCDAFIDVATNVMLAHCEVVLEADAAQAAQRLCDKYGHTPVIISDDPRLEALGITACLQRDCQATVWDPRKGEENLRLAEQAKVGVVYAEYGLTESGGVVLFSAPERGRAVSLLPESSLFVLRKSTLLPRVAQLAQHLHHMAQHGERMPSCINIIGGPSSTADIELIKVVGVHGPINAAYLIVEDC
ncbi:lactate utilization protein C [Pectobacterium brasiliense]|uniref:Lactate utilization protein B/C n=1 Tax=Pectobacterium brasiliense TaxID=180957 RepID=A0A0M2EZF7_9GAMM|nr:MULTISPECIES: lactate utilization protein C [Pectobacterium]KGA33757.1 lactate utilization protein B/C [Pectobacterium brasiliense]MBN3189128.1 lactate utilization protein C [Pectobacterium brasiliense]MCG5047748.1 lactate utilization protein C [Pectobacterium brasiliense]MCL6330433.1 lactate utilization protein C [Pectobacterium carotovorum subsp. carotovorum]